ncbi:MAG: DUF6691 family protein [Caulobacteraceae bacterium]
MMRVLTAAALGVLFGLGLLISGMTDPAKVLGFLDVAGAWNPQLAFVMGGAVAVSAPAFWIARRRAHALLGEPIELPQTRPVTRRLLGGAALFGLGWGLAGICPGPGLVLVGFDGLKAWVFALAVLAGGGLAELWLRRR